MTRADLLSHVSGHSIVDREEIYDQLMNARKAPWVELAWMSGDRQQGAIIFNEFKGTGRLINIDDEISIDFRAEEIRSVQILEEIPS